MKKDSIIKEFTDDIKKFQQYAKNIAGDDADDLFQMVSLMILEMPEEKLISYYNHKEGLKPAFLRMLILQYRSKTSYFHKDYRKEQQELTKKADDIIYNTPQSSEELSPEYLTAVENAYKELAKQTGNDLVAQFEQLIWDTYVDKGSLRKTLAAISENYPDIIDLKGVHEIVKRFQATIKKHLTPIM